MKKDLKRQIITALAVAVVGTAGGVLPAAALDTTVILPSKTEIEQWNTQNGKAWIYGVAGGNTFSDIVNDAFVGGIVDTALGKGTVLPSNTDISSESAGLTLGYLNNGQNPDTNTRYYGAVGGDIVIGTGYSNASAGINTVKKDIDADIENHLNGGAVLGGFGGSTAIGIGGINSSKTDCWNGDGVAFNSLVNGEAHTTVRNVTTNIEKDAKVIGFFNGGLAAGVGAGTEIDKEEKTVSSIPSSTTAEVNGNTSLIITGGEVAPKTFSGEQDTVGKILNAMWENNINAAGLVGGGAAISTLGGNAKASVSGQSGITVNNATVVGVIGGGAAVSADATGIAGLVLHKSYGNEGKDVNGYTHEKPYTDIDVQEGLGQLGITDGMASALIPSIVGDTVYIENVNEGGSASSSVGSVNIAVQGNSAAAGVIGGGLAAAEHMYAGKTGNTANQPLGSSDASASVTGDTTIVINMDKNIEGIGEIAGENGQLGLEDFANSNIVVGVAGGGAAAAFGDANTKAAVDSRNTVIDLEKGYVTGAFGGGIAVAAHDKDTKRTDSDSHLTASASVKDTNLTVEKDSKAVGIFGNGLSVGMEFEDGYHIGTAAESSNSGTNASVVAENTTVNILGNADAVFGGGLLLSNGAYGGDSVKIDTAGISTINVVGGHVENTSYSFLNAALESIGDTILGDMNKGENIFGEKAGHYLDDLDHAAGNVAILGGHVAVGQGGYAHTYASVINMGNDSTVKGDIVAGGISDVVAGTYGTDSDKSGVIVDSSEINLAGDKIDGSVYAGGIKVTDSYETTNTFPDKDKADSIVKESTVNLMGMEVTGEISGAGYEYTTNSPKQVYGADLGTSILNISGTNTLTPLDNAAGKYTSSSKIHDFDAVNFKAGSETIVKDLTAGEGGTALISGGKVTVEDGASLNIDGLDKTSGNTYQIAANTDDASTFWDDSDLIYDRMNGVYATTEVKNGGEDPSDTSFSVTYDKIDTTEEANAAADSMTDALGVKDLRGMFREGMNDGWKKLDKDSGAGKYLDDWQMADNKTPYQKGMLFGEDAAVTGNTVSIARAMADNVTQRLSFTDDYVQEQGWANQDGGVWAKYMHRKYETDGMSSSVGGIRSGTDYDGILVGMDLAKNGKFQSGVAIHYGSGEGDGLISHNDYDAWGITLYGSLKDEEAGTNLMADIGWMTSDNDIDGTVNGTRMSADRDVDAWTIGIRGEKEFVSGKNQIVPYAGLRYMSVNPGSYTTYYGGKAAFHNDAENQDLWLLPIGVSFRNETVTNSGWKITPKVDLSYIWAFGDTDTDMTVNAGGYTGNLYYDVMDDSSWLATLGVEAEKDAWTFGINYGYQKGDDTKNKTWYVTAGYSF